MLSRSLLRRPGSAPLLTFTAAARCLSASAEPLVTTHVTKEKVGIITLNNPAKLNAMTVDLGDEFEQAVQTFKQMGRDQLRAVVLTGAGKAFSAGGDMSFLKERTETDALTNSEIMRRFYSRFLCVRDLEVPVVAAINGPAIGAGLCVACACDLRIASTKAKMGWTFVGLGLHPGMGATHFVPALLGPQLAAKWLLTGGIFDGAQAAEMGLVLEACEPDEVLPKAMELAESIAKQSPVAVGTLTRTLRMNMDDRLQVHLAREADAQGHSYAAPDIKEGIDAILAKRLPQF